MQSNYALIVLDYPSFDEILTETVPAIPLSTLVRGGSAACCSLSALQLPIVSCSEGRASFSTEGKSELSRPRSV